MQEKQPGHILLVEDNPLDIELTLDAFRTAQLEVRIHVVRNGQEALDYLFGRGPYADRETSPLPDIILLDLKLPGIDGHEVLAKMKSAPMLKRLPVIILTSSQESTDLSQSYDNGANSYLTKPLSVASFVEIVRQIDRYWLRLNVGPPST